MAILDQHQLQPIEEILEDLHPRIQHVFNRFRIPPRDARNVLQQTLLIYLHKRHNILDAERWLLGTLRNRCLVYWRDRRQRVYSAVDQSLLASVARSEDSPQVQAEVLRDLNSTLAEIPKRYRSPLWLRYKRGGERSGVAEPEGASLRAAGRVKERCLAALTRALLGVEPAREGCDD
jgi:DNA-directed RNA polymerase specialized sigma24 family protein